MTTSAAPLTITPPPAKPPSTMAPPPGSPQATPPPRMAATNGAPTGPPTGAAPFAGHGRAPTPRWWADAAGAVAVLSLVVVAALWSRTDLLRITVKDLGDGSARVARLRPATRVLIEGPYGRLTAAGR